MHKRRDIREAAVQFLYLADLEDRPEDGAEPAALEDSFWQLIQENSLRKLTKARAKAMLHVSQGRAARLKELGILATPLLAELRANGHEKPLTDALHKLIACEGTLTLALDHLSTAHHGKSKDGPDDSLVEAVVNANAALTHPRRDWSNALLDSPAWKTKAEKIVSTIAQLERVSERIGSLDSPDGGISHIQSAAGEITSFRAETETLVRGILEHKTAIDAQLSTIVDNYSPSRVNPVDRAILRLGCYELTHCSDVPRAVAINEAMEVAKRFSTTDSARFINGILDAIK